MHTCYLPKELAVDDSFGVESIGGEEGSIYTYISLKHCASTRSRNHHRRPLLHLKITNLDTFSPIYLPRRRASARSAQPRAQFPIGRHTTGPVCSTRRARIIYSVLFFFSWSRPHTHPTHRRLCLTRPSVPELKSNGTIYTAHLVPGGCPVLSCHSHSLTHFVPTLPTLLTYLPSAKIPKSNQSISLHHLDTYLPTKPP